MVVANNYLSYTIIPYSKGGPKTTREYQARGGTASNTTHIGKVQQHWVCLEEDKEPLGSHLASWAMAMQGVPIKHAQQQLVQQKASREWHPPNTYFITGGHREKLLLAPSGESKAPFPKIRRAQKQV